MNKILLTVIIVLCSKILVFSQKDELWIKNIEKDGITIYYQYYECHDYSQGTHKEYVLFKFVNNSRSAKKIEWDFVMVYDDSKDGKSNENHRILEISANETIISSCTEHKDLRIFSQFLNISSSRLKRFYLQNVQIVNIK